MDSNRSDNDDLFPHLGTDGESVPWTPQEILAEAEADAERRPHISVPFVVQAGSTLLMVEADDEGWTLAELAFHRRYCVFQETRRASYTWPREAFGAMLSRLAGTDLDDESISQLTDEFSEWIGSRFAKPPCNGPITC